MIRSVITADFTSAPQEVWDVVTDNRHTEWRSDIKKVRVIKDGLTFVEYSSSGLSTTFQITKQIPCERYEFNLENKRIMGFWSGKFMALPNGGTRIVFAENIHIKNRLLRMMAGRFLNLKKMQETYVRDLRKKLGEE